MITRFPAVALLVTLVAHSVDPGPAELRFDWPGDLVARVETERTRERNTGTLQSRTARLAYRMQVSSHDEGWLVAHDQFSVQGPSAAQQRESAELLEAVVPDMIVSRDGEFRRVENIAALRAFIEKLVTPLLDRPDVPPAMRRMLERMTSEEGLSQLAAREWQVLVGTWRELPLTDEPITARVDEPSPFLPGIVLQMDATARIVGRGPCVRAGVSRAFGTQVVRSRPEPATKHKGQEPRNDAQTRRSVVTRPTSTHSTTKMLPWRSNVALCGQTNLPSGKALRGPSRIACHES